MRFSSRTSWNLAGNALSQTIARARARGVPLLDWTEANPTRCGLPSNEHLVALLGHPRGASYDPDPRGIVEARTAVAEYYRDHGVVVRIDRVVLSASTSEAYGWLFKLLCDRGDVVLVPRPSYPLLTELAALEDVRLAPYPLVAEEGFRIDVEALEKAIDDRTRAISMVHPNNPTGAFARRDDAARVEAIAKERGLALIVDEVFLDYAHGALPDNRRASFVAGDSSSKPLTFVMSGLSKVAALPQVKLGWTVVVGPEAIVDAAMARLEVIADSYLSVATPVQRALPEILARRGAVQDAIRARLAANLATIDAAMRDTPVRRLPSDGGWYAVLEVPRTRDEDDWVRTLIEDDGVIVHPGWFFDFEREGILVVGLLAKEDEVAEAAHRLVRRIGV